MITAHRALTSRPSSETRRPRAIEVWCEPLDVEVVGVLVVDEPGLVHPSLIDHGFAEEIDLILAEANV